MVLDATQDGIEQIAQVLAGDRFREIHIFSHGTPGCLYLGNAQLSLETLDRYTRLLQTEFASISSLFLYGCNVAAGDAGAELIAKKVLEKAGMTTDDIDVYEINEAFSVVAEKFIRDLDLDREKVNINGGAMALGHPIGATGSILIGTALDELERSGGKYGLITMCAAGGMAPAIIIERV